MRTRNFISPGFQLRELWGCTVLQFFPETPVRSQMQPSSMTPSTNQPTRSGIHKPSQCITHQLPSLLSLIPFFQKTFKHVAGAAKAGHLSVFENCPLFGCRAISIFVAYSSTNFPRPCRSRGTIVIADFTCDRPYVLCKIVLKSVEPEKQQQLIPKQASQVPKAQHCHFKQEQYYSPRLPISNQASKMDISTGVKRHANNAYRQLKVGMRYTTSPELFRTLKHVPR